MNGETPGYVIELARQMRKEPTEEEAILWEALRNNKLGVKFRKQHTLGRYISDFYCHHEIRQREIESRGLRVIRIRNEEIRKNFNEVIEKIMKELG